MEPYKRVSRFIIGKEMIMQYIRNGVSFINVQFIISILERYMQKMAQFLYTVASSNFYLICDICPNKYVRHGITPMKASYNICVLVVC